MRSPSRADRRDVAAAAAIVLVSALLGVSAAWMVPGLDRYTRDWMMRLRGVLPPPDDIAIVAIDETSINRLGRFPWSRSVMGKAVETIAKARPRVIALDVLYTDATTPDQDAGLANAISAAGNVVVAAQLDARPGGQSVWLSPLPQIARAAASVGHVNVHAEAESIAREFPLRSADDAGAVLYAMPVEAIRIAERLPPGAIVDRRRSVVVGSHEIPVNVGSPTAVLSDPDVRVIRAARIPIDYLGPVGSFSARSYSIADVLDGSVGVPQLADKYVLIGATAASLGDRFAAPFTHRTDLQADQHGALMPGVEVLANALNTILRHRFYRDTPGWLALAWAAAVAAIAVGLLGAAQGNYEWSKQLAVLVGVGGGILAGSYLAYKHLLIFPPVTGQVVSFASAGALALLRRSVATGTQLDRAIGEMAAAQERLLPVTPVDAAAEAIARLTGAPAVAILRSSGRGRYRIAGSWGLPSDVVPGGPVAMGAARNLFAGAAVQEHAIESDRLLLAVPGAVVIPDHVARAAVDLARAYLQNTSEPAWKATVLSPAGLEARARALGELNTNMIERWGFVDLALHSVQDGLLIAGPGGRISFANAAGAESLQGTAESLIGRNLLDRLNELEPSLDTRDILRRLLVDRAAVEREITIRSGRPRRYTLRLAPVVSGQAGVIGIVSSLSDITRQLELQQTKNDVISLVSHEMKTPLTAIQGMSELLAGFDMPADRRTELSAAINDEAKRLTRMITQYLDITRLESGATVLRQSVVRVEQLIRRTILMLEPAAAQRGMRFTYEFGPGAVVLADPDLLSRAIENLASNAMKYGSAGTPIHISTREEADRLLIEVHDRGPGIGPDECGRIFEKFYRAPRSGDADVPGTGLGLPLVREIAELHGGSVTVRSELNVGSVFTLSLPLYPETQAGRPVKKYQI